jgi:hypothetical protein
MSIASKQPTLLGALTAVFVMVLTAGCVSQPTLLTNLDKNADFSAYRTYAYEPRLGTDRNGYSTLLTEYLKSAIDAEMTARGYEKVASNPDLFIDFNAKTDEKADIVSTPSSGSYVGMGYYGGYYGYRGGLYSTFPTYPINDVRTVRYRVGTLNVDIVDAKRKQLIWEGLAEGRLSKDQLRNPEPTIRSVITDLFKQYPGHAPTVN